jgi:sugar lactone lactonase YvrE
VNRQPLAEWSAELVLDARADLGEGPLWDVPRGELLWVDVMAGLVHRFDPESGTDRSYDVGQPVSAIVARTGGGHVLALRDGFALWDGESATVIAPVESSRREIRMNDGACDSRGRFWAGTMHVDYRRGEGALYRLDESQTAEVILSGVTISNGIAWSPDDTTMYYVDTPTQAIDAFDFDAATGVISDRRRLVEIDPEAGSPDGLVVDSEGCIWVALWDGWAVRRYDPDGKHLGTVAVPVARVTKPAFGGPDLTDLFITTASPEKANPSQPYAGGVFHTRPGVRGLATNAYVG